jgi:hypothetical protein
VSDYPGAGWPWPERRPQGKPLRVAAVLPSATTDMAWSQSMSSALKTVQQDLGGESAMEPKISENMADVSVAAADSSVKVSETWTGSFTDVALMGKAAEALISAGADVLTGTSEAAIGSVNAAKERGSVLWFGNEQDQASWAPNLVVACRVYDWTGIIKEMNAQRKAGKLRRARRQRMPSFIRKEIRNMRPKYLVAILVLLALALPASPAHASGVVSVCDAAHLTAALTGGGTVTFTCSGTITLTSTLTIAANTTIDGTGQTVTISGNKAVRVFQVNSGVTLNLKRLTVANGYVDLYDPNPRGAGVMNSGGTLIIDNSTISGNYTLYGAGVYSAGGSVTVRNSNFVGNYTYSTLDSYGGGSGVYIVGGTLDVVDSTFSGNDNDGLGGGVYLGGGTLKVSNSTFSGNSASDGGAIHAPSGTLTISNSTFTGNYAAIFGGGVSIGNASLTVINSTFSGNAAFLGGASFSSGGTAILRNTIAANSAGGKECRGLITDLGGNLSYPDSTTCPGIHLNPLLGPLQDNGGPTKTMALGAGSPAIDAADDATCAAPPVNNLDQRGITRPQGAHCDIGAFEQQNLTLPHPLSIDIKPGSDPNSLNCRNAKEVIAVAILTTDAFDAATVDHTTVGFEGASETHVDKKTGEPARHEEDVDGDGDMDLVFHFRLGDARLTCASTEAGLRGATKEGQPISGADFVRMVGGG